MGIEDGGHGGQPLARSLSPEPRGLETIGQSHHDGPKLVFDILLGKGKDRRGYKNNPRPQPCPKPPARPRTGPETQKEAQGDEGERRRTGLAGGEQLGWRREDSQDLGLRGPDKKMEPAMAISRAYRT